MLILVGTEEMLLDDSRRMAARARESGVDVTLEIWDGMIHAWPVFAAVLAGRAKGYRQNRTVYSESICFIIDGRGSLPHRVINRSALSE